MSKIGNRDMSSYLFQHIAFPNSEMSKIENSHPKCGKSKKWYDVKCGKSKILSMTFLLR